MHIKSFFAATVPGAMEAARKELGPNALFVTSRQTGTLTRHLGTYEVVFASEPRAIGPDPNESTPMARGNEATNEPVTRNQAPPARDRVATLEI